MTGIASCLIVISFCTVITAEPQDSAAWVLRFDGIGPVRVGMTLPQLDAAMGETFSLPQDRQEQPCFFVEAKQHPDTAIMILQGKVARIDITAPDGARSSTGTAQGIHIGDSEARVQEAYGSKVVVSPHAYNPGAHYLTIRSGGDGLRFETDKGKVTSFYAGSLAAISFIEGCD